MSLRRLDPFAATATGSRDQHTLGRRSWYGLHATFQADLSWAAEAIGVKFPSGECGRSYLWSILHLVTRWRASVMEITQEIQ
jgi:hypothetical protein